MCDFKLGKDWVEWVGREYGGVQIPSIVLWITQGRPHLDQASIFDFKID